MSKQLIGVLSARTLSELEEAISPDVELWTRVFNDLKNNDFSHLNKFKNFTHASTYSYVSLKMALELIPNFSINSLAYGSKEAQAKKFKQLLNALTFLDCDTFLTLILKRFRWTLVEDYLQALNIPSDLEIDFLVPIEKSVPVKRVKKNVKISGPDEEVSGDE